MKKINFLHQKVHFNFSNTCSILAGRKDLENCLAAEQVKKYIVIVYIKTISFPSDRSHIISYIRIFFSHIL